MRDELQWCKPAELARRWNMSEDTIVRHLYVPIFQDDPTPSGKIRAMRFGRQYRVHVQEAERFERMAMPAGDRNPTQAQLGKLKRVSRRRDSLEKSVPDYLGDL